MASVSKETASFQTISNLYKGKAIWIRHKFIRLAAAAIITWFNRIDSLVIRETTLSRVCMQAQKLKQSTINTSISNLASKWQSLRYTGTIKRGREYKVVQLIEGLGWKKLIIIKSQMLLMGLVAVAVATSSLKGQGQWRLRGMEGE
jgi:hypothetical protein